LHTVLCVSMVWSPLPWNRNRCICWHKNCKLCWKKRVIEHVPLSDRQSGYYSHYFLVSKKDGGLRPILDLHSLNPSLRTFMFKMSMVKMTVSNSTQRLVCHDRPQGCIFSHGNYATTQEVPEVRFRGWSLPISGSYIWPSLVTPHMHKMHGCSTGSFTTAGHPHFKLHRRLVDTRPVSRACATTYRPSSSLNSGLEALG